MSTGRSENQRSSAKRHATSSSMWRSRSRASAAMRPSRSASASAVASASSSRHSSCSSRKSGSANVRPSWNTSVPASRRSWAARWRQSLSERNASLSRVARSSESRRSRGSARAKRSGWSWRERSRKRRSRSGTSTANSRATPRSEKWSSLRPTGWILRQEGQNTVPSSTSAVQLQQVTRSPRGARRRGPCPLAGGRRTGANGYHGSRSDGERFPAAAGALHVRVPEHEAGLHERLLPVDRRALQEHGALRVHEHARAVALDHLIELRGLLRPVDEVGEARTAAALHAEAEPAVRRLLLAGERPDPDGRLLADLDGHGAFPP